MDYTLYVNVPPNIHIQKYNRVLRDWLTSNLYESWKTSWLYNINDPGSNWKAICVTFDHYDEYMRFRLEQEHNTLELIWKLQQ